METKVKNREWVKDAAIVFLAVLLVLTFFSNTIMNRTLPEVATAQVTDGSIVAKVRGSGVVTANGKHQVKAKEIRTIRAVMIKAGQEVNAGDVLFVLGEGDATALEQAQEQLRNLQYSYQRSAAGIPNFDYSSYYRTINNAQRTLDEAVAFTKEAKRDYDRALGEAQKTSAEVNANIKAAEAELDASEGVLKSAESAYNAQQEQHNALDAKISEYVQDIKTIITKESQVAPEVDPVEPTTTPAPTETQAPDDNTNDSNTNNNQNQESQNNSVVQNQESQNNATGQNQESQGTPVDQQTLGQQNESNTPIESNPDNSMNQQNPSTGLVEVQPSTDPSGIEADTIAFENTASGKIELLSNAKSDDESPSNNTCPLEEKKKAGFVLLSTAPEASSILTDMETAISAHVSSYGSKSVELAAAEENLKTTVANHNTLVNSSQYIEAMNVYTVAKDRYFRAIEMYDRAIPASVRPYKLTYEEAQKAEAAAAEDLNYAYESLASAQESNSKTASLSYIDLAQTAEEIKILQEKIKSLAGDEENVITANVSGTVDTVDCTAGDTVLKDALLATIEVPDMGHTLSFSVTNDQAQRLRIGDTATISNYYWGNSITATLTSIRSDPKNPQTNKLLTFDLTGDVTTGAELTISVGQKSANYDLIVPNSAIKSDTNGSYVLAVSVKSSPLGNRYTARRVSVEVLANDDNNSAVVADLGNGDYVITTSSAPLNSGDMVRMADS